MKKIMSLIILMFLLIYSNISLAKNDINLEIDKNSMKKNEEVSLNIQISDTLVAAFTLEIYFDMGKLEYVKGPDNSNFSNNRILYTWVDGNARDNSKIEVKEFKFKAIEDGIANIVVIGEGYNSNGDKIELNSTNLEIQIGEKKEEKEAESVNFEDVSDDNTNLQVMRLNHEGISPEFSKDTKEYYFIADTTINDLEVTAIPENKDAKVVVTGNTNLKMGLNTINIQVTSKDGSKKSDYKINITKTSDLESANANLENLAIRQGDLFPEFDNNVTKYRIDVANDIKKLDILAVPEKINSKVEISSSELEVGDNNIIITVIAKDGITRKKYEITAHRRNEEEEKKYSEEQNVNAQHVQAILDEKQEENVTYEEAGNNDNKKIIIGSILIVIIIAIVATIIIMKKLKKQKNK